MEKLTNRSREIADKKMTFLERIYLPAILGGMWITLKHFFRKPATSQYPKKFAQERKYIAVNMF
jgi:NADH-quinone oxidoreductase subunit I